MSGYINLHRAIQKHWIYKEDRVFSKFEAWTDILMRVNHAEAKVMHNGALETVLRGQTIWSLGDMETRWKWSNKKVKRFLDCLVADQMLSYKSTTKKTYLTVENYDFYQSPQGVKAPPMHHEGTTEAFQKHTNKNDKELNNDKERNKGNKTSSRKRSAYEPDSIPFRSASYLLEKIREHSPNVKEPNLQQWANDMRLLIETDKREPNTIASVIDWSTSNSFWQSNILSASKLREKFDTLQSQMNRDKVVVLKPQQQSNYQRTVSELQRIRAEAEAQEREQSRNHYAD